MRAIRRRHLHIDELLVQVADEIGVDPYRFPEDPTEYQKVTRQWFMAMMSRPERAEQLLAIWFVNHMIRLAKVESEA